jgi:pimeloyl-ACP methyl ester carboxylesterase
VSARYDGDQWKLFDRGFEMTSTGGPRRSYVDARTGQIHVRLAGPDHDARRPLLCFHLSPVSGVIYETWLAEMGRDRLTIAPDTPGYGMSDPPATAPAIADFAAAMGDVMDALGLHDADVMGYHTGSKICVELARQRPEAIRHLVLVSTPVYTTAELASQRAAMGHPDDPQADGSHLLAAWHALYEWRGPQQTPADLMRIFPDHVRGGERKHWGHQAAFAYTYPDTICDVAAPILVLNPNDDLVTYTPRIRTHLQNGRVLDLPEWGHGFLDRHTAEAAALIRPFLDESLWPHGAV